MAKDLKLMRCTVLGESQVGKASVISLLCNNEDASDELDKTAVAHCAVSKDGAQRLVPASEKCDEPGTSIIQYISPRKRFPLHNVFLAKCASPGVCLVVFKLTQEQGIEDSALKSVKQIVYDISSLEKCRVSLIGTHKGLNKGEISAANEHLKCLSQFVDCCSPDCILWAIDVSTPSSDDLEALRLRLHEHMNTFAVTVSIRNFTMFRHNLKEGVEILKKYDDDGIRLYRCENNFISPKYMFHVLSKASHELSRNSQAEVEHFAEHSDVIGLFLYNCEIAVAMGEKEYAILGNNGHGHSRNKEETTKPLYVACSYSVEDSETVTYYAPSTLFNTLVNALQRSGWQQHDIRAKYAAFRNKTNAGVELHITHHHDKVHDKIEIVVVKRKVYARDGVDAKQLFIRFSLLCQNIVKLLKEVLQSQVHHVIGFLCAGGNQCTNIAEFEEDALSVLLNCPKRCSCPEPTWRERIWYEQRQDLNGVLVEHDDPNQSILVVPNGEVPDTVQVHTPHYVSVDSCGKACINISWDKPSSSAKITEYAVCYRLLTEGTKKQWKTVLVTDPRVALTGQMWGKKLEIEVRAISDNGRGPFSKIKQVNVKKTCSAVQKQQEHGTIGIALLIVNTYPRGFKVNEVEVGSCLPTSEIVDKWKGLLRGLRFHVNVLVDQYKKDVKQCIYDLSYYVDLSTEKPHLLVIFCGHGTAKYVYDNDGSRLYIEEDIIRPLIGNQGKAECMKFFLIDACRSEVPHDDTPKEPEDCHELDCHLQPLDKCSNFLVAYSTLPGSTSKCGCDGPRWSCSVIEQLNKGHSVTDALSNANLELMKQKRPTGEYHSRLLGSVNFREQANKLGK